VLLKPVVLNWSASAPAAVLLLAVVLLWSALTPMAVLLAPMLLLKRATSPTAVLSPPMVLLNIVPPPTAVFPLAVLVKSVPAAPRARRSRGTCARPDSNPLTAVDSGNNPAGPSRQLAATACSQKSAAAAPATTVNRPRGG